MLNKPFEGRCALVTGASGAIGSAIARQLWEEGAHVFLTARRKKNMEDCVQEWGATERVDIFPCDLEEEDAPQKLFQELVHQNRSVDILVNNSGMTQDGLSMRMSTQAWSRVIHMNLTVPFQLSQLALSSMMSKRWGRIVNIGSVVSFMGNSGQANYVASKAGLFGVTKTMAREVASRGITVNLVAPGFIDTDMTKGLSDAVKEKYQANIPCQHFGTAQDIAYAVAFLANPKASYITGQALHVNGGLYMGA